MPEMTRSKLLVIAALALATPVGALAKADPCDGKSEGNGDGKGVVIGAHAKVRVVVAEVRSPKKVAKFTLENSVGEPPMDLTFIRKGADRSYSGPVQLHLCAREFHARETCNNTVAYKPGIIDLKIGSAFRVKLKVSCK
jgi:hypothetical protein